MTVNGLSELFAELYSEGREANEATVKEIMKRLEAGKNYIPSSVPVRREYAHALLSEYGSYITDRDRADKKR